MNPAVAVVATATTTRVAALPGRGGRASDGVAVAVAPPAVTRAVVAARAKTTATACGAASASAAAVPGGGASTARLAVVAAAAAVAATPKADRVAKSTGAADWVRAPRGPTRSRRAESTAATRPAAPISRTVPTAGATTVRAAAAAAATGGGAPAAATAASTAAHARVMAAAAAAAAAAGRNRGSHGRGGSNDVWPLPPSTGGGTH